MFVDTNVLVYAFSKDLRAAKAELILQARPHISVQALNEFSNGAFRKLQFTAPEIAAGVQAIINICAAVHVLSVEDTTKALALCQDYSLAFYDALMLATALRNGATFFYSEDMQNGLIIEGQLTITNPF